MDPVALTVAFKGTSAVLAIVFGFLIARYGFHLYKDGAGYGRDRAAFEAGPVKIKAQSAGSVIMGTAFLWVWAAVAISPNLDKRGDDWKVSFSAPDVNLESPSFSASLSSAHERIESDPEELKKLFAAALLNQESTKNERLFELNGRLATIDPQSIGSLRSETGQYLVTTEIKTTDRTAKLAFEPRIQSGQVIFVPAGIGLFITDEKK